MSGQRQLVDVITALRSDIEAAMAEGEGKALKFELGEIEVDLLTQIIKTGDLNVKGGVEFKVLGFELGSAGAEVKGSYSQQAVHTIKLKPKQWDEQSNRYQGVEMSDLD